MFRQIWNFQFIVLSPSPHVRPHHRAQASRFLCENRNPHGLPSIKILRRSSVAAAAGIELQTHRSGSNAGFVHCHKESGFHSFFNQAQVSQMSEIAFDPNQIPRPRNLHDFLSGAGERARRNSADSGDEFRCPGTGSDKYPDVDMSELTKQIHKSEVRFVFTIAGARREQESCP